jgi:hypothetical protein
MEEGEAECGEDDAAADATTKGKPRATTTTTIRSRLVVPLPTGMQATCVCVYSLS